MVNLDFEDIMSVIKIIDFNIEIFIKKTMVALIFKIDVNSTYIEIGLIKVILKFDRVKFEILSFQTIVIYLIYYLIIFVLKNKYYYFTVNILNIFDTIYLLIFKLNIIFCSQNKLF